MKYEIREKKVKNCSTCETVEIVYNGKVYGEWEENANVDYPEDFILDIVNEYRKQLKNKS